MNIEFENIETLFTYQLRGILTKTEAEVAEVKERIKVMGKELEMLGKKPSEEDHNTIDIAAQFMALANIIKYQVKAELFNRRFELN
jgi:flagellar basal body rod protein FlgB